MKRNRSITRIFILSLITLFLPVVANAGEAEAKVVGLLFYADWCGSCKVLEPKLDTVKKEFADEPILFTRVDVTDDFTMRQSAFFATCIGLSNVYESHAPKTGFMLLIDAESGEIIDKLTKDQSEKELKSNIQKALQS